MVKFLVQAVQQKFSMYLVANHGFDCSFVTICQKDMLVEQSTALPFGEGAKHGHVPGSLQQGWLVEDKVMWDTKLRFDSGAYNY
jgi:hypothetical protein